MKSNWVAVHMARQGRTCERVWARKAAGVHGGELSHRAAREQRASNIAHLSTSWVAACIRFLLHHLARLCNCIRLKPDPVLSPPDKSQGGRQTQGRQSLLDVIVACVDVGVIGETYSMGNVDGNWIGFSGTVTTRSKTSPFHTPTFRKRSSPPGKAAVSTGVIGGTQDDVPPLVV